MEPLVTSARILLERRAGAEGRGVMTSRRSEKARYSALRPIDVDLSSPQKRWRWDGWPTCADDAVTDRAPGNRIQTPDRSHPGRGLHESDKDSYVMFIRRPKMGIADPDKRLEATFPKQPAELAVWMAIFSILIMALSPARDTCRPPGPRHHLPDGRGGLHRPDGARRPRRHPPITSASVTRMTIIDAQTERTRLDRSARCAEKRRGRARTRRLRGLVRPVPGACTTEDAGRGENPSPAGRFTRSSCQTACRLGNVGSREKRAAPGRNHGVIGRQRCAPCRARDRAAELRTCPPE